MSKKKLEFVGWILFKFSAIGFIIGSADNTPAHIGSILFLFACTLFILALLKK